MNAQCQAAADLAFFVHETLELANPDAVGTLAKLANNVLDAIHLPQLKLSPEEIERRKLLSEFRHPSRDREETEWDREHVISARHKAMTKDAEIARVVQSTLPPNVLRFPVVPRLNSEVTR